jgi:NNP family nitrate/nitrite transporter-like MFS transporter
VFLAVGAMIVFSLFVQMSEGATYSVVPFINRNALGSVAGIVGAGGNAGAVAFGFLFRAEGISTEQALFLVGIAVVVASALVFLVRFSTETEAEERKSLEDALASRGATVSAPAVGAD